MIGSDLTGQIAGKIRPFVGKDGKGIAARRTLEAHCPVCGGAIETTPFGYGCSNYRKDGSGCKFSIGQIAGRDLSDEEVTELLTEGKTSVLSGFTSKAKKKFSASLVLNREADKVNIGFDFSDNTPDVVEGVVCPMCGGAIQTKTFGFGCANYEADNPESCRFAIGTIAGKTINEKQLKQLLIDGRTETIRGFKSKSGKKFDACLALDKREDGTVSARFDFEHVEAKKIKDVKCPICGGDIVKTGFGFGCANYDKSNPESCRFAIGKIAGVTLKEAQVKELLIRGKTEVICGFIARTGMKFDAPLKLKEDGTVAFDFPEKPKPVDTTVACPKCGKLLKRGQWQYECECGFKIFHTVAKVPLTDENMTELFATGRTSAKITGFTSKSGSQFDAYLKMDNDKIVFDFDDPKPSKKEENNGISQNQHTL
jgi:DNA topoisomerase-3